MSVFVPVEVPAVRRPRVENMRVGSTSLNLLMGDVGEAGPSGAVSGGFVNDALSFGYTGGPGPCFVDRRRLSWKNSGVGIIRISFLAVADEILPSRSERASSRML